MSSDDEDDLCRFGTPLDPIQEDEVPTTKKITLADQIAVDSNGKRRFHGAFTGGFSAGFWNTVGSQEGWQPSEFKSSRGEKASHRVQKPSDFMDDEDVGEFGIAPQRIQTTEDFAQPEGHQRNKRKLQSDTTQGPIPGAPVLELILESCRDKAAVRLLKRMDKRYAKIVLEKPKKPAIVVADDEPMDANESMETKESTDAAESDATLEQEKVYKCDMGPIQRHIRSDSTESHDTSSDDEELVFDDDEFDAMLDNLKSNRFGLSYQGLDKGDFFTTVGAEAPIIQNNFSILPTFTMVDQNKKKVTIKGQAFGVGAFEEDDDDIYGRDDMSKYDFRLDSKSEKSTAKNLKSIQRDFIAGFNDATKSLARITPKNIFKVQLPFRYEPRNWLKRKSRFGPEIGATTSAAIKGPSDKPIGRHDLTPDQRGQILGDKKKDPPLCDIDAKFKAAGLKTLNFASAGVESDSSEKPEASEELSSKIDENLMKIRNKTFVVPDSIPYLFDRFTASNDSKPLSELDPTKNAEVAENKAAKETPDAPKEVQKVTRTKSIWVPCPLLCYKMNMEANAGAKPEKGNTFSLFQCIANTEAARRNRLEFTSVGAEKSQEKSNNTEAPLSEKPPQETSFTAPPNDRKMEEPAPTPTPIERKSAAAVDSPDSGRTAAKPAIENRIENPVIKRTNKPKTELEMKIMEAQDEHPSRKKDIFKAIFDSDSDDGNSDDDDVDGSEANATAFRNPFSINADLMATLTKPSTSSSAIHSQLPDEAFRPKSAREINILRNTSPPRGIFSGLIRKPEPIDKTTPSENQCEISTDKRNSEMEEDKQSLDTYGPSLPPPMPPKNPQIPPSFASTSVQARNSVASVSLGKNSDYRVIYEEKWIEKSDEKEKKSKKEKKHKKDKDKHKSKKPKKEKHKKKKR